MNVSRVRDAKTEECIMALVKREVWDPFKELREMSDRLDRVFALEGNGRTSQALMSSDFTPSVNISETEKAYLVRADLPEVKKDDIKLTCDKGMLTIEGERRQERTEDNERFHRVESTYGRFVRRFSIPEDADDSAIDATYKDGTLTVRIPKAGEKAQKTRQIKVA
jgi:HSP20 family protein